MATTTPSAQSTTHLSSLIQQQGSSTIYPTEDDILAVLAARARADLPYTYLDGSSGSTVVGGGGGRTLIVVNPLKSLGNLSDLNAKDYVDKYVDPAYVSAGGKKKGKGKAGQGEEEGSRTAHLVGSDQPHLYDLAGRAWLLMQRRREDQSILFR
jgi:chitin synthase